jgi:hypothetical protein
MKRRALLRRRSALPRAVLAVAMLAVPVLGAGLAYAASPQASPSRSNSSIQIDVRQQRIPYGQALTVSGRVPWSARGHTVVLDFQRAGSSDWQPIASTQVRDHAHFWFHKQVQRSGRVKVTGEWPAQATSSDQAGVTSTSASSDSRRVTVVAWLRLGHHESNDYGDHVITVPGRLQPGGRPRRVQLEVLSDGHWHTGAVAQTGRQGRFELRFTPHSRWERLRVRFGGDRSNAGTRVEAGTVTVFSQAVASWYYDAGSTACGYHAYYGVANLSLPCGTKVKLTYHGRTVNATVDDRGPYIAGRTWDLNQNTAGALGFSGVDTVWASR